MNRVNTGGKRILKVENILLPNSNVRPVIPQVFHRLEFIHIHCVCIPAEKVTQAFHMCCLSTPCSNLSESREKEYLCFFHILVFSPFICKLLSLLLPFLGIILSETQFLNLSVSVIPVKTYIIVCICTISCMCV